ncbi:11044_t:CDS:2 [Paraglomus brasilianum]|uniref:Carboxypeptidase n=1 Tax=Paraglomus brasilianum TaxID=144538 RepID=A0A9N9FWB8_9GLOM|nr:11044_t:CDS:2 [Paraglomus brasilianum]
MAAMRCASLLCFILLFSALIFINAQFDVRLELEDIEHSLQEQLDDLGNGFEILTHAEFPEHSIRLKPGSLCDNSVKQYTGYLDAGSNRHFFFWFFESRNNPSTDPIVLWLNGGPGCSSLTGLLFELGPCSVNEDGTDTIFNPHSWNNNASVIFLDQPMNVGFSYGSGVSNTNAAAQDVLAFLQIFFNKFQQYGTLDFHIAGESYAGHYIPAIAHEILTHNYAVAGIRSACTTKYHINPRTSILINFKSVLIGNGLVDPLVQYKYYPDMACNSSYSPVLDEETCDKMRAAYPKCAQFISNCYKSQSVFNCLPASMYCNKEMIGPYQRTGKNPYDVRKNCEGNSLCYPILESIEKYLNREEVKRQLGVDPGIHYKSCNHDVNFRFMMAGDWMHPYHELLPKVLDAGVRVLIYAGDADYICNWIGNEAWVKALEWSGKAAFNAAKDEKWITEDVSETWAGNVRSSGSLTWLRVFEAGHMVPYDQASNSLDFFNRWLQKRKFCA